MNTTRIFDLYDFKPKADNLVKINEYGKGGKENIDNNQAAMVKLLPNGALDGPHEASLKL
jgi:hypothetical protein